MRSAERDQEKPREQWADQNDKATVGQQLFQEAVAVRRRHVGEDQRAVCGERAYVHDGRRDGDGVSNRNDSAPDNRRRD